MSDTPGTPRRRRLYLWVLVACICALVSAVIILGTIVPFSSDDARQGLVRTLEAELDSDVELDYLQFRLFPRLRAEGGGLVIRHRGRRDVPPLISIAKFSAEGSLSDLIRRHISRVTVERLDIQIPPKAVGDAPKTEPARQAPESASDITKMFVIDELVADDAQLVIVPRETGRTPKMWAIHHLRMTSVGADRAIPFVATLTNAIPPGEIDTMGSFGPWQREDPGTTPIEGEFAFERADLSVFKGISGILSSRGTFNGPLERLVVRGRTETPQFTITSAGQPFPLTTTYHAIVDGTNGDTLLEQVNATFLKSSLVARGGVVGRPGRKGRIVTLDVVMDSARLGDVMTMAVKSPRPPMTGGLALQTKLVLPPGERDVVQRLRLNGRFEIANTRFTDDEVQQKINNLSRRTQGKTSDEEVTESVASNFAGTFALADGQLTIPDVAFNVPGATVQLQGRYGLQDEQIAFEGMAYTDAKVSQMTTGIKSLLLKPVDLLFRRKGGGAAIPVKITGTRGAPSFGLDRGRIFSRRQSP